MRDSKRQRQRERERERKRETATVRERERERDSEREREMHFRGSDSQTRFHEWLKVPRRWGCCSLSYLSEALCYDI